MCPAITDNRARHAKTLEDVFFKELDNHFVVIRFARNGLDPFGHILNSNKDVQISLRGWERTHEVDAPNIEKLYGLDVGERHHVPT